MKPEVEPNPRLRPFGPHRPGGHECRFEFHEYVRPARLDAAGGVLLGVRLIKSKPADIAPHEKRALKRVREATVEVQRIAKLRDRLRPQNLKDEDRRFDAAWGAVEGQLAAWARLDDTPPGRLAAELLTSLFPYGLVFLTRSYEDQWFESKRRLERIDEEGLEESLTSLVNPDLLAHTRDAHAALGEGLGAGDAPFEAPDGRALLEALRTLSLEVASYARVLAGSVDDRDEETANRFRAAMAPLAAYRATHGRGSGDDDPSVEDGGDDVEDVDPEAPIPEPTDGPNVDEPIPPVS